MRILSLFDGIGTARVALDRAGIKIDKYYSSEIYPQSIAVSEYNYPGMIERLGDVRNYEEWNLPQIDLLIGGSPCIDLSVAMKDREGLEGKQSSLFWYFVECIKKFNPKYFILENAASMKKEDRDKITEVLGVKPIIINSKFVSAQSRRRLYWTNLEGVTIPEDKGLVLQDVLESGKADRDKSLCITSSYDGFTGCQDYFRHRYYGLSFGQIVLEDGADPVEQRQAYKTYGKYSGVEVKGRLRELTALECERLQTLPDDYTKYGKFDNGKVKEIPKTTRYKIIGSAFTADVITHLLTFIK